MSALNRRRLFQFSGGLALAGAAPAWSAPSGEDWSDDIDILRQAWNTLHPGLYRYTTPPALETALDALAVSWRSPQGFRERFLALTRVTASIQCGHTYPSPYNGRDAVVSRLYPDRALVPFQFRWLDRRMVVTHDRSTEGVFAPGTVVTAIDGVTTSDLLNQLIPLARADGANDAKRISLMEMRGDDRLETFDIHLPLILPLKDRAAFTLEDGRTVDAALLTLAERQAAMASGTAPAPDANPWTLDKGADGIHRLTMPSWGLYDSAFDWRAWLGQTMDDLTSDGARGLIVDLRGNEGGLDCGHVILSRLIDRDLPLSADQRWVRYRRAPEALHPYLDTWDRSFLDWGDSAVASDQRPGFYRLNRSNDGTGTTVITPLGRRFSGRVAVICDASNSSATFAFARDVKDNGLATLVGQSTGGNRRGINGGAFFFLRLPASRIAVDLPLIAGFPNTPQPDEGIVPDLAVATTPADIAAGRDPQMAAAVRVILNA